MDENYNILDEAKLEFHKATCYFSFFNKEDDFIDDFTNQLRIILEMPYAFQIMYRDVRVVLFDSFHYAVHYTIKNNIIIITHILSQNQRY